MAIYQWVQTESGWLILSIFGENSGTGPAQSMFKCSTNIGEYVMIVWWMSTKNPEDIKRWQAFILCQFVGAKCLV